jgi:hypothetical protein
MAENAILADQIPKAVFSKQGQAILAAADTTPGLDDALVNAGATQRLVRQPGAESWAQALVLSGDLSAEDGSTLEKTISFAPMTTRKHYPGMHRVEALVNGRATDLGSFTVTGA